MAKNMTMTASQYMLYEITEPYVAEFCHPNKLLKIPHPPPALSSGLPYYLLLAIEILEKSRDTYIDVPYALVNIVRSRPGTRLSSISTNGDIPLLSFKVPH
jgi:hypothetical protein